jgi:nucleotide-binding universal stress UspA family protein
MLKVLLPVDGSDASGKTVEVFVRQLDWYREVPDLHLLNVQLPLRGNVSMFIGSDNISQYHQEEGLRELQTARDTLDKAGVACQFHIIVGDPADMIVRYAREKQLDLIVMGSGHSKVEHLLLGSVTSEVMQLSTVSVLLVK